MEKMDHRNYIVTAIVSTYNSERFIRRCLEGLLKQTIAKDLEITVVDTGSQQGERVIVQEFCREYDNVKYCRTEERESIYQAWNRGIKATSAKFITNANTDDRLRQDAFELLAGELEAHPEVALVYADQIITETENEAFDHCTPVGYYQWPPFDRKALLHHSCIGPQPMWRRSLHDEFGYFDETLKIAGDYEWWLRVSERYEFRHVPELLGVYLRNKTGLEYGSVKAAHREARRIRKRFAHKAGLSLNDKKYPINYYVKTYCPQGSPNVPEYDWALPKLKLAKLKAQALFKSTSCAIAARVKRFVSDI